MENKLSTAGLASILSEITGKNRKFCEDFIRELFRITSDALAAGENVRIKGFGNFKIVEVESRTGVNVSSGEKQEFAAHKKVVFTPGKEISSLINAPFEMFESVEIDDDIPSEILEKEREPVKIEEKNSVNPEPYKVVKQDRAELETNENDVSKQRMEEGSEEEDLDDVFTYEAYHENNEEEKERPNEPGLGNDRPGNPTIAISTLPMENNNETVFRDEYVKNEHESKKRFAWGFFTGTACTLIICLLIFMLGCFFGWWPVNFEDARHVSSQIEKTEIDTPSIPPVEEVPIPEEEFTKPEETEPKIYDTVTTTRYLTTIAREHYGNFNFWPYIYLENQSFLGHPDRITPGTKVVVPPLSKYGVNPENKDDITAAKKKGMEIYAKFK